MNILHISTSDNSGGAARAAWRLKIGLSRLQIQSQFLVRWKTTDDPFVEPVANTPLLRFGDKVAGKLGYWMGLQYLHYPSTQMIFHHPWLKNADVIQLHNIHGNFFAFPSIIRLSHLKPVVWYLHDMWPLTGHCAYAEDMGWKSGCGNCSCSLMNYPPLKWNTSSFMWKIKKSIFQKCRLTIVSPSLWLADSAKESPLLGQFDVHRIPYGLDAQVFSNHSKNAARTALNLSLDKKYILIGSQFVDDPRKGAAHLKTAFQQLFRQERPNWEILTMGRGNPRDVVPSGISIHNFGDVADEKKLALIYSAADVFVLPTLADNLPLTIMESMSCGTAVVAYRVGGVPDMIRHMETGYLAGYKDVNDLVKGVDLLLSNDSLRAKMSERSRQIVENEYTLEHAASRFAALYNDLLDKRKENSKVKPI